MDELAARGRSEGAFSFSAAYALVHLRRLSCGHTGGFHQNLAVCKREAPVSEKKRFTGLKCRLGGGMRGNMGAIEKIYHKYRYTLENGLFIIILAFYPLMKINQGLDVVDTSYSLTNFQYYPTADGTWMVATYLANAVGYFLMQLPKGDMLVGMNFYSSTCLCQISHVHFCPKYHICKMPDESRALYFCALLERRARAAL